MFVKTLDFYHCQLLPCMNGDNFPFQVLANTCQPMDNRTACSTWPIKLLIFLLISVSRVRISDAKTRLRIPKFIPSQPQVSYMGIAIVG